MIKNMFIKNKKAWLLRDFVIVGIMFGLIVAMYVLLVASTANNYNNTQIISASFAQHYSTLNTNLAQLDTSNKAVQGSSGLNLIGVFNVAFNSVFTVIAMIWEGLKLYGTMGSNIAGDFTFLDHGTILIFMTAIVAMLTAYIIFIWISSVQRGKI